MASDNEEVMPPAASAPPTTASAGTAPPVTVPGIVTTAAPPGNTTQALVVPIQQQNMTSGALAAPIQQPVISGPLGAVSAGGYTTTNVNTFSVSPVFMTTDTTVLLTVLSSGVLAAVRLADLQNKCAAPPLCCRSGFQLHSDCQQ